jgi:hypothetical protein
MDAFKCAFADLIEARAARHGWRGGGFSATLMGADYHCEYAHEVTRRGGPDIACQSETDAARCENLFGALKAVALPALGHIDDLAATSRSVYVKIQFGGLLGLQRAGGGAGGRVENIVALVDQTEQRYPGFTGLPSGALLDAIAAHKARGRRGR